MVASLPKFLVIRFAPGSGANFLTSILQCSPEVGHWQSELEHAKPHCDWLAYFKKSFRPDFVNWLHNEPIANQHLGTREIFSAWYARGNNLSARDYLTQEQQHCSDFYFELKRKGVYIPVYWHKPITPAFFQQATFVNILLDKPSLKWFDRSLYRKHYQVTKVNSDCSVVVQNNRHRPSIVPQSFTGTNEFEKTYSSFTRFIKDEIISNPWRVGFQNPNYVTSGYTLTLGDLLDYQLFKEQYANLCKYLSITAIPNELLEQLHSQWRDCHDY